MKKNIYIFVLLIIIATVLTTIAGAESKVNFLNLNKKLVDGEDMVSLRELGNKSGWNFYFENPDKHIYISDGDKNIVLKVEENKLAGNKLAVSPLILNGRTYISIASVKILLKELEQEAEQMVELIAHLSVNKHKCTVGENIKVKIELFNISDGEVTLKYASGQLYDLYLAKDGKEVWRWSKGKFFTMALIKKVLPAEKKLKYEVEVPINTELTPGEYILGGKITTKEPLKLNEIVIDVCK